VADAVVATPAPGGGDPPAPAPAEPPALAAGDPPAPVGDPPPAEPPAPAGDPPPADPAAEAAQALATAQPTLLESIGEDGKPKEVATPTPPADASTADPADAGEPPPPAPPVDPNAPPALPPIEYKFEVPEGITMSEAQKMDFLQAMDAARVGDGQKLLALHQQAMTDFAQTEVMRQHEAFAAMREGWRKELENDPVFGGANRHQALQRAASARNTFASSHPKDSPEWKADMAAFDGMDHTLGLGDHPVFLRFLDRVAAAFVREQAQIDNTPTNVGRTQHAGNGPSHPLYDHERSQQLSGRQ
jgi:hypothetical protein